MKKIYLLLIITGLTFSLSGQNRFSPIEEIATEVNLDSLVSFVRILSGEDSVYIDGEKSLIKQRVYYSNSMAEQYLFEKLNSFGYEAQLEEFSGDGTNVYAIKTGTKYPEAYYMICAHYDGVTTFCADDNASGTAAVLEAARLMKDRSFEYSVIFALWDEEEIGLNGSRYYANNAYYDDMMIAGVINLDMIAWDSDDDGLIEIHRNHFDESAAIADVMTELNEALNLGLEPVTFNPGASASDHSSFWNAGYGAILLIEGYFSGDFNPYYHSSNDRIDIFNLPYFHNASTLAISSLASLAMPDEAVTVNDLAAKHEGSITVYPNPSQSTSTVVFEQIDDGNSEIVLVNLLGQKSSTVYSGFTKKGKHEIQFDVSHLPAGLYALVILSENQRVVRQLVVTD